MGKINPADATVSTSKFFCDSDRHECEYLKDNELGKCCELYGNIWVGFAVDEKRYYKCYECIKRAREVTNEDRING